MVSMEITVGHNNLRTSQHIYVELPISANNFSKQFFNEIDGKCVFLSPRWYGWNARTFWTWHICCVSVQSLVKILGWSANVHTNIENSTSLLLHINVHIYFYRFCELLFFLYWEFSGLIQICRIWHFCTTEFGCRQINVDYILTKNDSLLLCEEPSSAKLLSDVKYFISSVNSGNVLPVILCWFYCVHFEMWDIYCRKNQSSYKRVNLQILTMKWNCFTCVSTNTTTCNLV